MTEDDFDILAAKVLAGEATAEETARMEEALAQDAGLREQFTDLRATWTTLKEAGPLANALNASPASPPREQLKKWQAAVEQQFGGASEQGHVSRTRPRGNFAEGIGAWFRGRFRVSLWIAAALFVALAIATGLFLSQPPSAPAPSAPVAYLIPDQGGVELHRNGKVVAVHSGTALRDSDALRLSSQASATVITRTGAISLRGPGRFAAANFPAGSAAPTNGRPANGTLPMVRAALFQSPTQMLALLVTTRSGPGLPVYSPVDFTADLTPLILWKAAPGKSYDIVITDEFSSATAPLRKTNVTSPLAFTNAWPGRALTGDGLYRLRIAESGNPITARELTFRTLAQTDEALTGQSAGSLLAAYEMLVDSPPRFGDALATLLTLPPAAAESELALRLKLFAFGWLGYHDDFHALLERLEAGH